MEAQGPIPDLLRKVLTAYETVSAGPQGLSSCWGCSAGPAAPGPPPCPGWGTLNLPHPCRRGGKLAGGCVGGCPGRTPVEAQARPAWYGTPQPLCQGWLAGYPAIPPGGRNPINSHSRSRFLPLCWRGTWAPARRWSRRTWLPVAGRGGPDPGRHAGARGSPCLSPFSPSALPGGAWGWGLPSSSRRPSPQMIQTSRTLIESADAVYGKLIQAQQAGGSREGRPSPGAAPCRRPRHIPGGPGAGVLGARGPSRAWFRGSLAKAPDLGTGTAGRAGIFGGCTCTLVVCGGGRGVRVCTLGGCVPGPEFSGRAAGAVGKQFLVGVAPSLALRFSPFLAARGGRGGLPGAGCCRVLGRGAACSGAGCWAGLQGLCGREGREGGERRRRLMRKRGRVISCQTPEYN